MLSFSIAKDAFPYLVTCKNSFVFSASFHNGEMYMCFFKCPCVERHVAAAVAIKGWPID